MKLKQLLKLIGILCILSLISFQTAALSYSQTSQQLLFAVTPYRTRDDVDFLIQHSTHPLDFLEGGDIRSPLFLSIITLSQLNEYLNAGYKPKIIDKNAGAITQYYMLTYDGPGPYNADLLKEFKLSYRISKTMVLVKLPEDKEFASYQKGDMLVFEPKRYFRNLIPPPGLTKPSIVSFSPTPIPFYRLPENKTDNSSTVMVTLLMLTALGSICGLIWKNRKIVSHSFKQLTENKEPHK